MRKCQAPFISVYLNESNSNFKPCCKFKSSFKGPDLQSYLQSDFLKEIRATIDQGQWHKGCSDCELSEKIKGNSDRTFFNDLPDSPGISYLDWRPGNTCNLKCRICNPNHSSAIATEMGVTKTTPPVATDDLLSAETRYLKLLGGEPFLEKKVISILEQAIAADWAKDIVLRMTTNGTIYNERLVELAKQFKKVDLQFSIDATGTTFDYLRWGARWNLVEEKIMRLTKDFPHFRFAPTISIYNILTVTEWLPWFFKWQDQFQIDQHVVHFTLVTDPAHTGLEVLLPEHRAEILNKLQALRDGSPFKDHLISQITGMLSSTEFNPARLQEFKTYNDGLDQKRQSSLLSLGPIFHPYTGAA